MKLLFIGAHPADLVDQAGGTIANHVKAGDAVWTLAVTTGLFSHPLPDDRMKDGPGLREVKIKECDGALDFLGVGLINKIWLRYQDGSLTDLDCIFPTIVGHVAREIRLLKPDVIITHHPAEAHHPDHAKVGAATMEASIAAARFIDWHDVGRSERHQVSNVFFYGYQFHPNMVKLGRPVVPPDVVVDIKDVIDKKAEAFMCLKSQYNTKEVVWERLNSFEREWGRQYGFEYAETFISYQPCRTTLLPDFGNANFQVLLRKKGEKR